MASIDYGRAAPVMGRSPVTHTQIHGGAHASGYSQDHGAAGQYAPQGLPRPDGTVPGRGPKLMQIAGALSSLALIVGLGLWGYRLAVRDVTGVPVVRAMAGVMRAQPADPGGELAANQGLAVNRLQAQGSAQPVADRVVLAPAPVGMIATDQSGVSPRPAPRATPLVTAPATAPATGRGARLEQAAITAPTPIDPVATLTPVAAIALVGDAGNMAALDRRIEGRAAPQTAASALAPARPGLKIIPASVPGVARSLRPHARPGNMQARIAARAPTASTAPAAAAAPAQIAPTNVTNVSLQTPAIDPASLPAGTRLAQLGAFDSRALAQTEWRRLIARFPDYFEGKSQVIQQATSGGRQFFRLRAAGFDSLGDARRFCSALLSEKSACIPVTLR